MCGEDSRSLSGDIMEKKLTTNDTADQNSGHEFHECSRMHTNKNQAAYPQNVWLFWFYSCNGVSRQAAQRLLAQFVLIRVIRVKVFLILFFLTWATLSLAQSAGDLQGGLQNGLRGSAALDTEAVPPLMPKMSNDDLRKQRSFAMQPPLIPHQIENYQVDKSFNKCMSCHGRDRVADSQAPMVSVTHFADREDNYRSEISPRRYFCTQCHVPQMDVKVPVANVFEDASKLVLPKKRQGK